LTTGSNKLDISQARPLDIVSLLSKIELPKEPNYNYLAFR
jgi:hypothetical protein